VLWAGVLAVVFHPVKRLCRFDARAGKNFSNRNYRLPVAARKRKDYNGDAMVSPAGCSRQPLLGGVTGED
jgi:hypothetical protein